MQNTILYNSYEPPFGNMENNMGLWITAGSIQKTLVFDYETTTFQKGNVFSKQNYPVLLVVYHVEEDKVHTFYKDELNLFEKIHGLFTNATRIIGFNLKFDLHWLRRWYGFRFTSRTRLFDCQQAEFLFSCQKMKYPSLNECCAIHDLGQKIDVVSTEYWDKGIDTPDIPKDVLIEYGVEDVMLTYRLYCSQMNLFNTTQKSKAKLMNVAMLDLPVLMEMEWNGLKYDINSSINKATELSNQIKAIEDKLNMLADNVPINWGSGQQVSKFLYGGEITHEYKVPIGIFKTGAKVGQTRYKKMEQVYHMPGIFDPLKGSEMAKEGIYSTDEATLRMLKGSKAQKKVIEWLLERTKLEKLRGTYMQGLPDKIINMDWENNLLHPSYNQCVTVTGRIASSNPNGQNMPPDAKRLCVSRYDC